MTLISVALIVSGVASGLFAGLMMTLVIALQPMWGALGADAYRQALQWFLPAAKGHPVITALTLLPIAAPLVVILVGATPFVSGLALAGAVFSLGILIVTLRLNFPIYATIMGWQSTQDMDGWHDVRQRFYHVNLVRFMLALTAFVAFLVALAA
jgi:hypothetical protein